MRHLQSALAEAAPQYASNSASKLPPPKPSQQRHALIIEDDALIGLLLGEVLEEMGYGCDVQGSESGAVRAAARHRPDLMIVDVRLREGSGLHAVDKILRLGAIPHIFITGDPARVYAHNPNAIVIQKPFREPELAAGIAQALSGMRII